MNYKEIKQAQDYLLTQGYRIGDIVSMTVTQLLAEYKKVKGVK